MKKLGILVAILLGITGLSQASEHAELVKRIDSYLKQGVTQGFSGAVLVAKGDAVIFQKGYGLANREKKQPFTPETIATVGSVTKQFTGAAILKLVAMGKLKVTDKISRFFKDLPNDKKDITVHQLLTHSAGFVDGIGEGDFDHMPTDTFFKKLFATPLQYEAGSKHEYSNVGYSTLGRIIELVSGQDYESFLNEQLFKPAGMKETGYRLPKWHQQRLANGYAGGVFDMGTLIDRFHKDGKVSWALKANGGIHSTLKDMYQWYLALKENKILSPSLTETLTTPYIAETEDGSSHYAYGWAIFSSERKTKIISHNGSNGVYFHDFLWLPEEDVVIIYSTNAYDRQSEGVAWRIERMMFKKDYQPKPFGENPYAIVTDFMEEHPASQSDALLSIIEKNHKASFKHPQILNRMGYMMLNLEMDADWTVAVFRINTKLFPENDNVWDSLGDGYLANQQKEAAIKSFKKAASMGHEFAAEKLAELQKEN